MPAAPKINADEEMYDMTSPMVANMYDDASNQYLINQEHQNPQNTPRFSSRNGNNLPSEQQQYGAAGRTMTKDIGTETETVSDDLGHHAVLCRKWVFEADIYL